MEENFFYPVIEECLNDEGEIDYILRRNGSFFISDYDVYLDSGWFVEKDKTIRVLKSFTINNTKELLDFCKLYNLHGLEINEGDVGYDNYNLLHNVLNLSTEWILVGGSKDRVISPTLKDMGWLTENDYFEKL